MGQSSLLEKQFIFSRYLGHFLDDLHTMGYEVTLGDAYRSPEMAALYEKQGKGIARSLHCDRLAIDLCIFRGGSYLTKTEDYEPAGRVWEGYSEPGIVFCWGGRFKHNPDGNHFSISHNGVR